LLRYHDPFLKLPGVDIDRARGLLHMVPRLETLTIHLARGGTTMTARLRHLTKLKLPRYYFCYRGLRNLTRACHNLVHFELTHDLSSPGKAFLPVSPGEVLDCLAPAKQTLQRLFLRTWLPDTALPADQFRLLDTLGEFTAVIGVALEFRAVARQQDDSDALVRVLRGLEELEDIFLLGVEGSWEFHMTFQGLMEGVRWAEWPRLGSIRLKALDHENKEMETRIWEGLESCLREMGMESCGGDVVVAGLRVVAVPQFVATDPFGAEKGAR
jgi:hypothetical protein